jgi:hypothetical protein
MGVLLAIMLVWCSISSNSRAAGSFLRTMAQLGRRCQNVGVVVVVVHQGDRIRRRNDHDDVLFQIVYNDVELGGYLVLVVCHVRVDVRHVRVDVHHVRVDDYHWTWDYYWGFDFWAVIYGVRGADSIRGASAVQRAGHGQGIDVVVSPFEDDALVQFVELILAGRAALRRRADGVFELVAVDSVDGNVEIREAVRIEVEDGCRVRVYRCLGWRRARPSILAEASLGTIVLKDAKAGHLQEGGDTRIWNKGFEEGIGPCARRCRQHEQQQTSKSACGSESHCFGRHCY